MYHCVTFFIVLSWILITTYIWGTPDCFFIIFIGLAIIALLSIMILKNKRKSYILFFLLLIGISTVLLSPEATKANKETYIVHCHFKIKNLLFLLREYYYNHGHFPQNSVSWTEAIQPYMGHTQNELFHCKYLSLYEKQNITDDSKYFNYVRLSVPEQTTSPEQPDCFIMFETNLPTSSDTHQFSKEWLTKDQPINHSIKYRYFQPIKDDLSCVVLFSDGSTYPLTAEKINKCILGSKNSEEFRNNIPMEYQIDSQNHIYLSYLLVIVDIFLYILSLLFYCNFPLFIKRSIKK